MSFFIPTQFVVRGWVEDCKYITRYQDPQATLATVSCGTVGMAPSFRLACQTRRICSVCHSVKQPTTIPVMAGLALEWWAAYASFERVNYQVLSSKAFWAWFTSPILWHIISVVAVTVLIWYPVPSLSRQSSSIFVVLYLCSQRYADISESCNALCHKPHPLFQCLSLWESSSSVRSTRPSDASMCTSMLGVCYPATHFLTWTPVCSLR